MNPIDTPLADAPADEITLIRAGAIDGFGEVAVEGDGTARPGVLAVAGGRVIDAGPTADLDRRYAADARRVIEYPASLILPGMVNAHTHLELSAIGPQPYAGDFIGWVMMLRDHFPQTDTTAADSPPEAWFAQAAAAGAQHSKAAGVQAVGDITRFAAVADARRDAGLGGVSFIEVFGMGPPWDAEALATLNQPGPADGFQPHAPYSAGPALFDAACAAGLPVSCHLAETRDEARFVADGDGPFLELLESMGKWSPGFAEHVGRGQSPVQWMEPYLRRAPWTLAHCNYVSDDDIALLVETGASVAYCPIASEYFGHADHRYRDMIDAGVNVCLGTDSIVCQPLLATQPLGILSQMRRLFQCDATDAELLLRMATGHGRRALQLDPAITRLATVAFDPSDPRDALSQTLQRDDDVESLELSEPTPERKNSP